MKIKTVKLKYNIKDNLPLSFGRKLRGFFANRYKNILFHNHKEDGELRYGYPMIQYKIIDGKPTIIGLKDGSKLIIDKFLDIEELVLGQNSYKEVEGELKTKSHELKINSHMERYNFFSPWLALNQKNFKKYMDSNTKDRDKLLNRILVGHILSFAKGLDWWIKKEVNVSLDLNEVKVKYKGKDMVGFKGSFSTNVNLPDYIGLGKGVSRGFGTLGLSTK